MDKWAELRTAYQVAKLGTVSAASKAIGCHRATVNRHIDVLEKQLGARIFIRHRRGYTLTEFGADVLRVAQKTDELIDDLAGRAKGETEHIVGEIKVTVLPQFSKVLTSPIAQFRAENPGCQVTIIASEDLARLEYAEAHIALRAGPRPDHPDYVVVSHGQIGLNLYAHDAYIRRMGMPRDAQDMASHEFAVPIAHAAHVPFSSWIAENVPPSQVAVSSEYYDVTAEAVLSGLGLGFLTDIDAAGRPDVRLVLPGDESWMVPLWLVTHVDLHRTEKVQSMLRCIKMAKPPAL